MQLLPQQLTCTGNDFAISGDALLNINALNVDQVFRSEPTATGNGWRSTSGGRKWCRKQRHIPSGSNLLRESWVNSLSFLFFKTSYIWNRSHML